MFTVLQPLLPSGCLSIMLSPLPPQELHLHFFPPGIFFLQVFICVFYVRLNYILCEQVAIFNLNLFIVIKGKKSRSKSSLKFCIALKWSDCFQFIQWRYTYTHFPSLLFVIMYIDYIYVWLCVYRYTALPLSRGHPHPYHLANFSKVVSFLEERKDGKIFCSFTPKNAPIF